MEGDCHTDLKKKKLKKEYYIAVPLYRRKFCDGHVILVFVGFFSKFFFSLNEFLLLL